MKYIVSRPVQITPLKLQKEVNNVIIPLLGLDLGGKKITEHCARRWLHKLGLPFY